MKRKLALFGLCSALALGAVACRETVGPPGIDEQGVFFFQVEGHKDTTSSGVAAFHRTVEDGMETLTLSFISDGARFQMTFEIREYETTGEVLNIADDPERFSGEFSYTAAGTRATYAVEAGTIAFTDASKLMLEGEVEFTGSAVSGPNPGSPGRVKGTFVAFCEGECLGGGEPPPGA